VNGVCETHCDGTERTNERTEAEAEAEAEAEEEQKRKRNGTPHDRQTI